MNPQARSDPQLELGATRWYRNALTSSTVPPALRQRRPAVAPGRDWRSLARGSRRRWVGAYGGTGTPAQRAERARAVYESGAHLPAGHTGHEPAAVRQARAMSTYLGPEARFSVPDNLTRSEARRLARYDSLVGQLSRGRISRRDFQRRVGNWRPFRGQRLASDPAAVLAALDRRRDEELELFEYRSGRAA